MSGLSVSMAQIPQPTELDKGKLCKLFVSVPFGAVSFTASPQIFNRTFDVSLGLRGDPKKPLRPKYLTEFSM